jgi:hypothetical protein
VPANLSFSKEVHIADFNPDSGNGADFTRKLAEYQKALREEWESTNPSDDDTPEEIARKARQLVIATFPRLIERATLLALGASSESVSMQAVKFLYGIIVPANTLPQGTPDPIEELMRQLKAND